MASAQKIAAPSATAVSDDAGAGRRIAGIIAVLNRLSEIVTQETALLQHRRPQALSETNAEKERLAATYARELREIKANPVLIKSASDAEKEALKSAMTAFQETMDEHARRLIVVKSVTESMVQAVAEEVHKRKNPVNGYGRNAALQSAVTGQYGANGSSTPLAVNQVI